MSDTTRTDTLELAEKVLRLANLQTDTMLKDLQHRTEVWKVVIAGMAAGGALVAATVAIMKAFGG